MYTIIALGNPGEEYAHTRHNAGRVVMAHVVEAGEWNGFHSAKLGGQVFEGAIADAPVRVVFPDTFMNHSGRAAKQALTDTDPDSLIIVYDDIDVPFGAFKLSYGRGAGGHNGMKSVIAELGTQDFLRVRVGIAPVNWLGRLVRPTGERLADYVLGTLTNREAAKLRAVVPDVKAALELVVTKGSAAAMTRFN